MFPGKTVTYLKPLNAFKSFNIFLSYPKFNTKLYNKCDFFTEDKAGYSRKN